MAETEVPADVGVSDSELFSNAVSEPPAPQQETPPPHPKDENRDIHGRFRPQGEQQPQQPQPPQPPPQPPQPGTPPPPVPQADEANVPSWRLREEREQRERLAQQLQERDYAMRDIQRRLDAFEQKQAPQKVHPDPLIDPQGYRTSLEEKFNSDLRTVQLENNLQLNRLQHGEIFDSAYQAFMQAAQGDPGFARLIVNSPNPGGAMVNWFRRAVTLARVGDDPEAFINSEIERRLSDPNFLSTALERARTFAGGKPNGGGTVSNNTVVIPPSLSRVPGGSPTEVGGNIDGMPSEQELFRSSLPPPRRKA